MVEILNIYYFKNKINADRKISNEVVVKCNDKGWMDELLVTD